MPLIIKDLHNSKQFLRWEEATEIGINCGVGIPYKTSSDQTWVMTFLSAQGTPIAERFEIWVPNESRSALVFQSGDCSRNTDLDALYASKTIGKGEGIHWRRLGDRHAGHQRKSQERCIDRGIAGALVRAESDGGFAGDRKRPAQGSARLVPLTPCGA